MDVYLVCMFLSRCPSNWIPFDTTNDYPIGHCGKFHEQTCCTLTSRNRWIHGKLRKSFFLSLSVNLDDFFTTPCFDPTNLTECDIPAHENAVCELRNYQLGIDNKTDTIRRCACRDSTWTFTVRGDGSGTCREST